MPLIAVVTPHQAELGLREGPKEALRCSPGQLASNRGLVCSLLAKGWGLRWILYGPRLCVSAHYIKCLVSTPLCRSPMTSRVMKIDVSSSLRGHEM